MSPATRPGRWAAILVLALSMAACADKSASEEEGGGAATIEPIEGTDLSTVTLTEEAAQRIDLQMAAIEESSGTTQIPYAAVLYDPDGATWAFVKADGLTFQREPITVDHIDAGVAFLTESPPAGTEVVTTGAPELYGAEIGVGDE